MAGNGRGKAHRASSPRGRSLLCAPGAWRGDPVQGDGNRSRRAEHGGHPGSPGHGARRPGRAARRRRLEGGGAEPSECWLTRGSRAPAPGNTNLFALTPRPHRSQTRRKRTVPSGLTAFPSIPGLPRPRPTGGAGVERARRRSGHGARTPRLRGSAVQPARAHPPPTLCPGSRAAFRSCLSTFPWGCWGSCRPGHGVSGQPPTHVHRCTRSPAAVGPPERGLRPAGLSRHVSRVPRPRLVVVQHNSLLDT